MDSIRVGPMWMNKASVAGLASEWKEVLGWKRASEPIAGKETLDRAVVEQERDSINLIIHTHLSYPHTTAPTTQHGCRVHLLQDHQGCVGSNAASRRCD
jgi:hypothetical protein